MTIVTVVVFLFLLVLMLLLGGAVMVMGRIGGQGFKYYLGRYLPGDPKEVRDPAIAEGQRLKVLGILARAGREGATDAELADALRTSLENEKVHRSELVKRGFVEDSGQRRTWALGSDAAGTLWRITDRGRAELAERLRQSPGTGVQGGGAVAPPTAKSRQRPQLPL